jgi:hypothetical protein
MTNKQEYLKKFKRCINEYVEFSGVREDDAQNADPAVDPTAAAPAEPAADPTAAAPAADPMGAAPVAPGGPAAAMPQAGQEQQQGAGAMAPVADPMGMDQPAEAAPGEAEGFTPEGEDVNSMTDSEGEDEEVIDVDELVDTQEKSSEKIDKLSNKFEKLIGKLDSIEQMINTNNDKISKFEAELEKRNPTPEEKLTLRSKESYPFNVNPMDYWKEKEATSNYSIEDDNNGADMPEYKITKDDIGSNWQSISKTFDDERNSLGLRDIFGY